MFDSGNVDRKTAADQWERYKDFFLEYEIAAGKANKELLPYLSEKAVTAIRLSTGRGLKYRLIGSHMVLDGWTGCFDPRWVQWKWWEQCPKSETGIVKSS